MHLTEDLGGAPSPSPPRSLSGSSLAVTGTACRRRAGRSLPKCPLSALQQGQGPVDIDFWESMTQANATTLPALTNPFNSSQTKVHVTLVDQNGYTTTWQKYQAGLTNGQLPDVAQLTQTNLQGAIDTQSILPGAVVHQRHPLPDLGLRVPGPLLLEGRRHPAGAALRRLHPDPLLQQASLHRPPASTRQSPPATLAQFMADAKALKAHGSGTGLVLDPWHLETWLATANKLFVNNGNGRGSRATKAVFDRATALAIWTDLDQLVSSGDAVTNPSTGPDDYDNLLGIGDRQVRHDHRHLGRPRHHHQLLGTAIPQRHPRASGPSRS